METSGFNLAIVGVASKALQGQSVSGDAHVIIPFKQGLLVAVIDGLGHGPEAAIASTAAAKILVECAGQNVISIIKQCHERLHGTRGVVISIASFNVEINTMTWLAVGNVEGYVIRSNPSDNNRPCILMRAGVVGHSLPPLRADTVQMNSGDILLMATDGIRGGFSGDINPNESPQIIADNIMNRFARETDDALIIAVRWLRKDK
ncbi:MAG: SpoIIE family protein phosphatase [Dehalococcoidales bacterium]